jgi:hypothetical protein
VFEKKRSAGLQSKCSSLSSAQRSVYACVAAAAADWCVSEGAGAASLGPTLGNVKLNHQFKALVMIELGTL